MPTIDPLLRELLDTASRMSRGADDVGASRENAAAFLPLVVGADGPIAVASTLDVTISTSDGEVDLRVYRPDGDPVGTLHYVHGGGWTVGGLWIVDHTARRLCRDLGMVVVTSAYRLAPEHRFPAAFNDTLAAARWVRDHAGSLGGREVPIIIAGDSAGANLVAASCLAIRDSGEQSFDLQLLLYPAVDLRSAVSTPSRRRDADPSLPVTVLKARIEDYLGELEREAPYSSPLLASSLAALPPALIVVLTVDPLRDEGMAYAERLREAGVTVETMEFGNLTHGFAHFASVVPAAASALEQVVRRLRKMIVSVKATASADADVP